MEEDTRPWMAVEHLLMACLIAPQKPESLLDPDGEYFVRSRPQYESYVASDFIVTAAHGVANDATGDQTSVPPTRC
jgi:hypothetical protein